MLKIKNAVAVITGGASGIGLALAQYWSSQGGKVVLADLSPEALAQAAAQIDGPVHTVACDVTTEEDNTRLAAEAMEAFGAINLVAPFAGIIKDGLFLSSDREGKQVLRKMPLEQFESVVKVNLTGVFPHRPRVRRADGQPRLPGG